MTRRATHPIDGTNGAMKGNSNVILPGTARQVAPWRGSSARQVAIARIVASVVGCVFGLKLFGSCFISLQKERSCHFEFQWIIQLGQKIELVKLYIRLIASVLIWTKSYQLPHSWATPHRHFPHPNLLHPSVRSENPLDNLINSSLMWLWQRRNVGSRDPTCDRVCVVFSVVSKRTLCNSQYKTLRMVLCTIGWNNKISGANSLVSGNMETNL